MAGKFFGIFMNPYIRVMNDGREFFWDFYESIYQSNEWIID